MRVIDADALIEEIDGMIKNAQSMGSKFDLAVSYGLIGANGVIKDAPTIEPSEYLQTIPTVYLLEALGVGSVDELMEEPSGDLISRDDAIRELSGACSNWEDDAKVQEIIMTLPSADTIPIIPMEIKKQFQIDNPGDYELKIIGNAKYVRSKCEVTDLISRADAVKAVEEAITNHDSAIMRITELPSVSAERVGEWVDVENEPYCECSVCGAYIDNLDDDYAFCPRCGAKMGE